MIHHIKRDCNAIERLRETIEIAHTSEYEVVGIETRVLEEIMNIYEDMLVNDIERIKRAKEVLKNENSMRRDRKEAIALLDIYRDVIKDVIENGTEDERERAKEIMLELQGI